MQSFTTEHELLDLQISHLTQNDVSFENGTYQFTFVTTSPGVYEIKFEFQKNDYSIGEITIVIFSEFSEQQLFVVQAFGYGTVFLMGLALLGAYYLRVLSVPRMLRWIRKMISQLRKGRIPSPGLIPDISDETEPVSIPTENKF